MQDRSKAINRMRTGKAIAEIALAQELLDMQLGSVEDALALVDDGAPLSKAEADTVRYWIKEIARVKG